MRTKTGGCLGGWKSWNWQWEDRCLVIWRSQETYLFSLVSNAFHRFLRVLIDNKLVSVQITTPIHRNAFEITSVQLNSRTVTINSTFRVSGILIVFYHSTAKISLPKITHTSRSKLSFVLQLVSPKLVELVSCSWCPSMLHNSLLWMNTIFFLESKV